jgi:hypothetical protein
MAEEHSSFSTPRAKKILAIGLGISSIFLGLTFTSLALKSKIKDKIDAKVDTLIETTNYVEDNEKYLNEETQNYIKMYVNGEITKNDLVEKIEAINDLDKIAYLQENISEKDYKEFQEYSKSFDEKKKLTTVGCAVGVTGFVTPIIAVQILTQEKKKENISSEEVAKEK